MQKQAVRLSVEIGGTFTDVILKRVGTLLSTKVLATFNPPEKAIVEGLAPQQIADVLARANIREEL